MSLVQPPVPDRKMSPTNPFASNNPFRSRASNVPVSPTIPAAANFDRGSNASSNRPKITNPFLDVFDDDNDPFQPEQPKILHKSNSFDTSSAQRPHFPGAAIELFENLSLTDHDRELKNKMDGSSSRDALKPTIQHGHIPSFKGTPPPSLPGGHRHSKSTETRPPMGTNGSSLPPAQRTGPNFRQPQPRDDPKRRPRRNSDSSIMEPYDMDKDRERERKERKAREARKAKDAGSSNFRNEQNRSKSRDSRKKSSTPLDIIDKLDVTGVYGSGLFHHDGPFDACNPHRNRNARRAPMQAFPADSANNALTGFAPYPEKSDHSGYYGTSDAEAYSQFFTPARRESTGDVKRPNASRTQSFNPVQRIDPVHGDESLGLGTSTFLDGAPASKTAIEQSQREAAQKDTPQNQGSGSGLGRKKSLSHKIRNLSGSRPRFNTDGSGRRGSDDDYPFPGARPLPLASTPGITKKRPETNPFFNDYDTAYEKKSESILGSEADRKRDRAPSSPQKPPGAFHQEQVAEAAGGSGGGGLLKRVRSLSKPKKRE